MPEGSSDGFDRLRQEVQKLGSDMRSLATQIDAIRKRVTDIEMCGFDVSGIKLEIMAGKKKKKARPPSEPPSKLSSKPPSKAGRSR